MTQFLARIVQLSPGEAASRVRAKVAIVERAMHQLTRPGLDPPGRTDSRTTVDRPCGSSFSPRMELRGPTAVAGAQSRQDRAASGGIAAPRTEEKRAEA